MSSAIDRLKELTAPTGQEELLNVQYPTSRFRVPVKQALLLAAVLIGGLVGYVAWSQPEVTVAPEQAFSNELVATTAPETPATEVVVSVVGEVEHPGLVTLAPDARIAEALAHAGIKPEGNILAVNQAQRVTDGMQIVVPPQGPPGVDGGFVAGQVGAVTGAVAGPGQVGGLTSINTATAEQLQQLPGVGEKTAQAIVEFRETHGGFTGLEQLQEVKGIGSAKFDQIKELVTL